MNTHILFACSSEMKDFNGVCGMYTALKSFGICDDNVVFLFNGTPKRLDELHTPSIFVQKKECHTHDVCFETPHRNLFRTAETIMEFKMMVSDFSNHAKHAASIVLVFSFHGVEQHILFSNSVLSVSDAVSSIFKTTNCPTLMFLNKCYSGETASALIEEFDHPTRPFVILTSARSGPSLMLPGPGEERVCSSFLRASILSLCEVAFRPTVTIGQHLERVQEVIHVLRGERTCKPPAVFPLEAYTFSLDTFIPIDFGSMDPVFDYNDLQILMTSVIV